MGCAGYFLYSSIEENTSASEDLKAADAELQTLQSKTPSLTKENVQKSKAQQEQVKALLGEMKTSFAPFPAPLKTDQRGFKSFLDKSVDRLQYAATNAGVGLPNSYVFGFSGIKTRLVFPTESIEVWTAQIQEIKSICDILFQSRINFLEGIRRVPVSVEDVASSDILSAASITNQSAIITPYEITIRAFSGELAAVVDGFQRSGNCFALSNIDIQPSTVIQESTPTEAATVAAAFPGRFGRGMQPGMPPGAQSSGNLVTILSEKPLHVTLLVNVVKLRSP